MNLRQRELRVSYADQLRARALHDVKELREALDLIAEMAEKTPQRPDALAEIARIARCALVGTTPPDTRLARDAGGTKH